MVLPFSGYQRYKSSMIKHNVLAFSSMVRVRFLNGKIWIQDGVPTKIDLRIAHDVVDITFISIEFSDIIDEKDIKLTINPILFAAKNLLWRPVRFCSIYGQKTLLYHFQ